MHAPIAERPGTKTLLGADQIDARPATAGDPNNYANVEPAYHQLVETESTAKGVRVGKRVTSGQGNVVVSVPV